MRWTCSAVLILAALGACSGAGGPSSSPTTADGSATSARAATPATDRSSTTTGTQTPTTDVTSTTSTSSTSSSVAVSTSTSSTVPRTTTTTAAPLRILRLRGDGLDRFDFGTNAGPIVDALIAMLGAPLSDDLTQLSTVPLDDGGYISPDDQYGFVDPLARTLCWTGRLCVTLGGTSAEALVLRGWAFASFDPERVRAIVATASGITLGVRWADHRDEIDAPPGGCYSQGYGTTSDGIRVTLDGGTWSANDEDGGYVTYLPDPAQVVVGELNAGDLVVDLHLDC